MNRKELERLIEFGLHLRGRLDGTGNQADAARDTLELSRLAKRLHHLDERYANGTIEANDDGTGEYDRKVGAIMKRARVLMLPYRYQPFHQGDPRGASLYAIRLDATEHDYWHDGAVPY